MIPYETKNNALKISTICCLFVNISLSRPLLADHLNLEYLLTNPRACYRFNKFMH